MRIGIDARFYGSLGKGLGRYTEKLLEYLERIDQKNDYVVFLRRENFSEYVPRNPRFKKMVAQYAWYGLAEQVLFPILLYRKRFDLVHFPHFNVPLFYRGRFIVTIHDLILVHYPTLRNTTRWAFLYWAKFLAYRLVIASAIRRAVHIITVSHFTERDILERYPVAAGKITVTYEAADSFCHFSLPREERQVLRSLGLLKNTSVQEPLVVQHDIMTEAAGAVSFREVRPYFLYVGNAYPHKNLPVLFALAKAFPEHQLVLVGKEDYFYRRLRDEAERSGARNILFAGFLKDQDLSVLYRFARLYLFPSLYEGFGLPPLEAMAVGTPVVSSDRGSLPEILGDAAYYFDPTAPLDLIAAVHRVAEEATLRQTLRERGYRQGAKFHFGDMAVQTLQIYQTSFQNKTQFHGTASSVQTQ